MNHIRLSIKRFLYLFLSILVVLPLIVIGGTSIFISSRVLRREIIESRKREVSFFSDRIEQYLRTPESIVKAMGRMIDTGRLALDSENTGLLIKSFTDSFDIITSVHIVDEEGIVVNLYPDDDLFFKSDISGHDYFRSVDESGTPYWAPSYISEQLDLPVTSFSYPLKGGVISVTLSLEDVTNMISGSDPDKSGVVYYVTDQKGVFIAHTNREKVTMQEYAPAQISYRMGRLPELSETTEYEGKAYNAYYSIVESSGWMVALLQPQSAIDEPVESMALSLLVMTILILGLTVIMSLILQKSLTGPLTALTLSTSEISHGVYSLHLPEARIVELSRLGRSIENMAHDIEDRESELNEASSYLSAVINSLPSILIGIDPELRITRINSRAEDAGAVREKDVLGKALPEFLPRLSREVPRFKRAMAENKMDVKTVETILETGKKIIENISIFPLNAEGLRGAVIRIDDVTEKTMMEEVLIQNEKMLSVGGLAAGMAHEINNPLAGMIQIANVLAGRLGLERKIDANLKAADEAGIDMDGLVRYMERRDIPDMIDNLNKSGRRISSIVSNMLSFVRTGEENVSTHSINEILDKSLELAVTDYNLRKKYDFRQIEIIREYGSNLPPIFCETSKVQQVFFNVLQNGAHAMSMAGIKSPRFIIRTRYEESTSMSVAEIEDNGPGMEESVRKRIFEPFFTTKPVGSGTGLGLSVSYFIITENQKGEMSVESSPGEGARFIIKLPAKR
ncbi:MAG: PAS domain-containing protein [Spirochaetales bacterium]|nr:PAS domain-containing protein [Spirochaetales bacterium]